MIMKPLHTTVAALVFTCSTIAGDPAAALRDTTPCCWEALFRNGTVACTPHGCVKGTVLYADGKQPRVKARLQGIAWKGKNFHDDGTFTNRWLGGVQAVTADTRVEPSWIDGQPCLTMQYAPNAPIFSNVRDEVRQIAPDVWLGRSFDAGTGCAKNWFVLQAK